MTSSPLSMTSHATSQPALPHRIAPALLALSLALGGQALHADGFEAGNRAFAEGRFAEAIAAYQADGPRTVNGWFNLGTARARSGEPGRAALAFERVLLLQPGHAEARHNLSIVRPATNTASATRGLWQRLPHGFGAAVAAAALWVAVWVLGLRFAFPERAPSRPTARVLVPIALLTSLAGALVQWQRGLGIVEPGAAVMIAAEPTPARFAPARSAGTVQTLKPGDRLRVLSQAEQWVYCELDGEQRGWIPAETVERILPIPRTSSS